MVQKKNFFSRMMSAFNSVLGSPQNHLNACQTFVTSIRLLPAISQIDCFNTIQHTRLYENEQNEREIIQWRLLFVTCNIANRLQTPMGFLDSVEIFLWLL